MSNDKFYNYNNLKSYLDKMGISYPDEYLRWLKDIVGTKISMFHYDNLPEPLTSEIVESALMFNNFLCFYKSDSLGIVLCRYRFGSVYDMYWKPKYVDLLTLSGKNIATHVPYEDIILVRDNIMDIVPFLTLNSWIDKIIDKEKTLDILIKLVRFPTILTGDKEQTASLKQVIKKATDYDGFIIGTKNFKDHLEQFDISLPVRLTDIYELLEKYKNMALASMGIYGVDEKRERIVTAEVNANNDYVDFVYTGMYRERQRFVKEANERFGLNIVLKETYVENEQDNIELKQQEAMAEAKAQIKIEETKNEGKVEAAKVEGIEAAKLEPKGGNKNE